jgi:hypothetical protein
MAGSHMLFNTPARAGAIALFAVAVYRGPRPTQAAAPGYEIQVGVAAPQFPPTIAGISGFIRRFS